MTKILLIEDDSLIVEPVMRSLRGMGYEVEAAHDGASG
ncbi:MAG: DNA-binding response regulator, partial [Anaerolineae bacterium]|nr:DNA-binding response regulator [Anaerolineae bacterium]